MGIANSHTKLTLQEIPPIHQGWREDPFTTEDDGHDQARIDYVRWRWHSQNQLLRQRDRQIEQNIRMLAGQQWTVWSNLLGRWVDLRDYLKDTERRWRHMPVVNRLMHWFMLLHARMTENPPVITFQPSTGDRNDAQLAEVMDTVYKHLWREAEMSHVVDELMAWLIPCGTAYLQSRIDPFLGDPKQFQGQANLQLMGEDGQPALGIDGQPITREFSGVPFNEKGEPMAQVGPNGEMEKLSDPFVLYDGGLSVEVMPCIQVRGEWGETPWGKKGWHMKRLLLSPEEAWNQFGLEIEPTISAEEGEEGNISRRILKGGGFFGAASGRDAFRTSDAESVGGYVEVFELWERPSRLPGTQRTDEDAGGRLLTVAGNHRVRDGQRNGPFPNTSPIRRFDFVKIPGRPSGTSPQEMMNGPQRTLNRVYAQILQNVTLIANPVQLIDEQSVNQEQETNRPGSRVFANLQGLTQPPVQYVQVPTMGSDIWRTTAQLRSELDELGNIAGAEGTPPTADASGELVKELRFNSDRFVGPTLRRAVQEFARMAEDWKIMVPQMWDSSKMIRVAGDDIAPITITVSPDMFEQGTANAEPDVESMLPEGRGERQVRVRNMYADGLLGQPGTPGAVKAFLDLARFPHIGRAVRPGGVDRSTAEQNVAKLLLGTPAQQIPVFEWYALDVHVTILREFMASPEYLKQPTPIQSQFVQHRITLQMASLVQAQNLVAQQAAIAGQQALGEVAVQGTAHKAADEAGLLEEVPDRGPTSNPSRDAGAA